MSKMKSMCMFVLLMTALCLTSCSERIDAGSEGILCQPYRHPQLMLMRKRFSLLPSLVTTRSLWLPTC